MNDVAVVDLANELSFSIEQIINPAWFSREHTQSCRIVSIHANTLKDPQIVKTVQLQTWISMNRGMGQPFRWRWRIAFANERRN